MTSRFIDWAKKVYLSRRLAWALLLLGAALRVQQYGVNRSLWVDEIFLATNIVQRDYAELTKPLILNQGAPVGFLWVERFAFERLGRSEYALRLFPLLMSFAALGLFYLAARRWLRPAAVPLALLCFDLCSFLVIYAAEVKQYGGDVLWGLILMVIAFPRGHLAATRSRLTALASAGAVAVWFSHASVFVLAGIGLVMAWGLLRHFTPARSAGTALPALVWLSSFCLFFKVSGVQLTQNDYLLDYWREAFLPLPPTSIADFRQIMEHAFEIFQDPGGFAVRGLAALAFLLGGVSLVRRERRELLSALLLPIGLAALASGLHKYPFNGRLLLFIVPALILLVSEGVLFVWEGSGREGKWASGLLVPLLLYEPVVYSIGNVVNPRPHTEIRPVIRYLDENWQPGDTLYLYYHAVPMFEFYMDTNRFSKGDYMEGVKSREDWKLYADDVKRLQGRPRVWVLFGHVWRKSGVDEERFFTYQLDGLGTCLQKYRDANASVYLYDLSGEEQHE